MKRPVRIAASTTLCAAALLMAGAALPAPPAPEGAAPPARWAVIVGISEYADPSIAPLEFADQDAWALASFLTSPEAGAGAVPPENLKLLIDEEATGRNLRHALITFLRRSRPEDVILIHFVGHSAADVDRPDQVYLLPHDTESEALVETGFPLQHVFHALSQAYSRQTILLADVSHSRWIQKEDRRGLLPNPVNRQILVGDAFVDTRFVAFTASEPGQASLQGRRWGGGHGVFTHYLLEGLRGAADRDDDGLVRLGELIAFTRDRVSRATDGAQLPTASLSDYDPHWILSGTP